MKDAAVSLAIFLVICIGLAFLLWGLSAWARQWRKIRSGRAWNRWLLHRNRQNYPEITGSDLEAEAANAEHGVTKFRGRHYDAA